MINSTCKQSLFKLEVVSLMLAGHRFASIPNTIKRGRLWVVAMSTDVNQSISSFSDRLRFDNRQLARLPVDTVTENYVRKVRNALFSRVRPTPLAEVRLVAYSVDALRIIDMTEEDTKRADFAEYFAGNRLWPGSDPSSHCYCGFQVRC